ncbi:MAG: hypothetical protein WAU36_18945 [Cyclobacteriaceae bacterium]
METNLIIHKLENVQEGKKVFVKNLQYNEWHDCDENEFVKNGIVYEKVYSKKLENVTYYFNPAIGEYMKGSMHLDSAIKDHRVCWLANMVTYYRHTLPSWNRCWGENGRHYRSGWFGDYDSEKIKVNERQKRKIARKHLDFIKTNGITVEHFKMLMNTDRQTIEIVELKLNGKKPNKRFASLEDVC